MPAKKAASKQPESNDMGNVWKWVFIVGALVAAVAGAIGFSNDILTWLLILAGVLVGLFWRDTDDLKGFGIRYLLLAAVASSLGAVPAIGGILTGFFQGFVGFLGPVALATLFMYFWKKYFASMM
jgi:uncharacterized membrane protein